MTDEKTAVVPVEPTLEMQKAYFDVIDRNLARVETDPCFGRFASQKQAYAAMLAAAPAHPGSGGEAEAVGWAWEKTGTDTDGDPVVFIGKYGDYEGRVTLSRTDRSWSATLNRGHGKLGLPSEGAGIAHVESTAAYLLKARLQHARTTIALYAAPPLPVSAEDVARVIAMTVEVEVLGAREDRYQVTRINEAAERIIALIRPLDKQS